MANYVEYNKENLKILVKEILLEIENDKIEKENRTIFFNWVEKIMRNYRLDITHLREALTKFNVKNIEDIKMCEEEIFINHLRNIKKKAF